MISKSSGKKQRKIEKKKCNAKNNPKKIKQKNLLLEITKKRETVVILITNVKILHHK